MTDPSGTGPLLSRSAIADRAGVERPAVTNWQRRYPDYPKPIRVGAEELFSAVEVHRWLSTRVIPRSSLRPEEVHGTTFGDRFAAASRTDPDPALARRTIDKLLLGKVGDRFGSVLMFSDYSMLLQELLHLRTDENAWKELRQREHMLARLIDDLIARSPGGRNHRLSFLSHCPDQDLGYVIRLINELSPEQDVPLAFDILLDRTAELHGRRGSEVFTPSSVREAMLAVLAQGPAPASLYDPYCRSGELLVDAAGLLKSGPTVHGATSRAGDARTSELNLAVHAVPASVLVDPRLPGVEVRHQYDMVLTNPPFGMRADGAPMSADRHWPFGVPTGWLDLAWVQHVVMSLSDSGRGAVVMPSGAAFRGGREQEIRAALVESGAVECIVSLPGNLFASTGVPVTIWFLRSPRPNELEGILMIDATELGTRSAGRNSLDRAAVAAIASAYRSWHADRRHTDISLHLDLEELRATDYALLPTRYLSTGPRPPTSETSVDDLLRRLDALGSRAEQVDRELAKALKGWAR
ncbi:N-6 DNA methylase [Kitasatospora sp. NPDC088783]|uniref:N-6 DNA methylase n=1 Tax=Kitasatospora sp. NPDC088783 TaxID=3364077 RepID=UPI003825B621